MFEWITLQEDGEAAVEVPLVAMCRRKVSDSRPTFGRSIVCWARSYGPTLSGCPLL